MKPWHWLIVISSVTGCGVYARPALSLKTICLLYVVTVGSGIDTIWPEFCFSRTGTERSGRPEMIMSAGGAKPVGQLARFAVGAGATTLMFAVPAPTVAGEEAEIATEQVAAVAGLLMVKVWGAVDASANVRAPEPTIVHPPLAE